MTLLLMLCLLLGSNSGSFNPDRGNGGGRIVVTGTGVKK